MREVIIIIIIIIIIITTFNLRTAAFKAYCVIWVRRTNFRHQAYPRVTTREHPAAEGGTVGEKCPGICLNADLHLTFRDLLHAVKLRHGTDGFTSPED